MRKKMKISIGLILFVIAIFVFATTANAVDKYTSTSIINGINVNWEYELNDLNQIENLKCTNISDLSGSITIPAMIDGKNVISIGDSAFKGSEITEVTIPSTVKEIGLWAFSGCEKLETVDLGKVEEISTSSFENCTSLSEIKIPESLVKNASGAPFRGCTNLTKITFEEGMTRIPSYLCSTTPIKEITIPSTVKEIDISAFSNCTELQEVEVPALVSSIGVYAFANCDSLKKITILDNVTDMGWSDLVFNNHNADLTIYCYEGSFVAEYAIKNNIKYVYLQRSSSAGDSKSSDKEKSPSNSTEKRTSSSSNNKKNTISNSSSSSSSTPSKLPYTGVGITVVTTIFVLVGFTVFTYKKYNSYRDIK